MRLRRITTLRRAAAVRAGAVVVMLAGCGGPPTMSTGWTAFVYPDAENIPNADQTQNYTIGTFRSFEACQQAAVDRVRFLTAESGRQADYQCGFKCLNRKEYAGLLICKETRK